MERPSFSVEPVEELSRTVPRDQIVQQPEPAATHGFLQVRCVCNRLLCEALPGSTVKIVCPRCGALIRWPSRAVEVLPREKPQPQVGDQKPRRLETKGAGT